MERFFLREWKRELFRHQHCPQTLDWLASGVGVLQRPRSVNRGEELRSCGGVRSKPRSRFANFVI